MTYATVAPFANLPVVTDELTYALTAEQLPTVTVGQLVLVRLRGRRTHGVITGLTRQRPRGVVRLETVTAITPITLPGELLGLARLIRRWYWQPLGRVFGALLPPPLLRWGSLDAREIGKVASQSRDRALTLSLVGGARIRFARYDQLIARALKAKRSALVVFGHAAELAAFVRSSQQPIIVWRATGSKQQRWQQWTDLATAAHPLVVAGLRSAIGTPIRNLGLIIVDSPSARGHKDDQAPHLQTARVAKLRAAREDCHLVYGDVLPILSRRPPRTIRLPSSPPSIELLPSNPADRRVLQAASEAWLADDPRATTFVLINQLGAGTLRCRSCGRPVSCPSCLAAVHAIAGQLDCRQCGWHGPQPAGCQACGGPVLVLRGTGTERVATQLAAQFGEPVGIFDRAHPDRPTTRLMVGTEFALPYLLRRPPDQSLFLGVDFARQQPSYDASERALRLVLQLATLSQHTAIETNQPTDPWFQALHLDGITRFTKQELADRLAAGFPPAVTLIRLSSQTAEPLQRLTAALPSSITALGPTTNRETLGAQLLVKLPEPRQPSDLLAPLAKQKLLDKIAVDVDPSPDRLD